MRTATPSDTDAIARLVNTAFLVEQFFIERDRTNPATVRSLLEKGKFLVAEDAPNLVGCIYVELRGEHSYLGLLSVAPQRQGTGLGRQLVGAAEQFSRGAGCRAIDLRIVSARAELLPFYRRLGYAENGTAPFPADVQTKVPSHFIRMTKGLS